MIDSNSESNPNRDCVHLTRRLTSTLEPDIADNWKRSNHSSSPNFIVGPRLKTDIIWSSDWTPVCGSKFNGSDRGS